jgi:F420-dependent oxidoreductase-like protein
MKGIRIGVTVSDAGGTALDRLLAQARQSVWTANIFGVDAMTLAALAGRETSRIEIGTAVVPTFSRHPFYCAQQALTTQAALGGRFVLGLGPSHKVVIENMLGLSYAKPARHVREYVTIVKQLLEDGKTSFEGETYHVNGALNVACDEPPPLLIGALGPLMRKVAGALCDGTITWMTGRRALGEQVVPGVREAAEAAGRPEPRIVAGIPVVVTDDPDGARETAAQAFAMYGALPSYQAMFAAEGAKGPADLALVGDEKTVETAIQGYADTGVTDFQAALFPHGPDPKQAVQRTHALLGELARR